MYRKLLILIGFLLSSLFAANAQIGKIRGLVNNYVEQGSSDKQVEASIPMAVIEPVDGVFNTAGFAADFPDLDIEVEKFEIDHPDMTGYIDTIYVIWFLKDLAYLKSGQSNIIIFGISPDLDVHYYFDNNNDRVYSPGETVVDFEEGEKSRIIEMDLDRQNEYQFANPFYEPASVGESQKINYETWQEATSSFSSYAFGGFSFGVGDAWVSYNSSRFSVDRVKYFGGIFASGRFTLGVGVDWKHLNLQTWGAFEVLDYDETWKYEYINGQENVNYNTGVWMKNKLYAGLELGYDIPLIKGLSVGPAISYSLYKVVGNKPIDPALDYSSDARYNETSALEYIIRIKVISSERAKIEFRTYYSDTSLDAHEFFPDFDGGYSSTYTQIYFGANYLYRFGK